MEMKSKAIIISFNTDSEAICASAARISTTKGNAIEIYENAKKHQKNQELIRKVLQSGHKSFIEHAVFTIAFLNVSAYVEQFFIECRLASFTIKSRRYVDFSELGYYVPCDLGKDDLSHYCQYMDMLFDAYHTILGQGIPKEDARFLLPYSFHSNFYCTLNARELVHVINAIISGRGREIPELQNLADQIAKQLESLFPGILYEFDKTTFPLHTTENKININKMHDQISFITCQDIGITRLINSPSHPFEVLDAAHSVNHPTSKRNLQLEKLLESERPRELEQLSYTFLISNITLSGITHIVRHRMQSIIIPPIKSVNSKRYIVPATIMNVPEMLSYYKNILTAANDMIAKRSNSMLINKYYYYYALSANVMDIMTTINARELLLFISLRSCNRAQWEIRDISINMLGQLRGHFPELFNKYGPSCFIYGQCPEGRMTCGKMSEVISQFE